MSEPRRWTVEIYEQGSRREVTLRDQNWDHTLEIDNDGDLRVEFDVDSESYGGGTRTVGAYFPMAKVIEFLRAAGYEVGTGTEGGDGERVCPACGETPSAARARWAKIVARPDFDPEGAPTPCDHAALRRGTEGGK